MYKDTSDPEKADYKPLVTKLLAAPGFKHPKCATSLFRASSGHNGVVFYWLIFHISWEHPSPAVLEDGSTSQGLLQSQPEELLCWKTSTPSAFQGVPQSLEALQIPAWTFCRAAAGGHPPGTRLGRKGLPCPLARLPGAKLNHLLVKIFFNILLLSKGLIWG